MNDMYRILPGGPMLNQSYRHMYELVKSEYIRHKSQTYATEHLT